MEKRSVFTAALLAVLLSATACSSTRGDVSGGVYTSPAGNFSVPVLRAGRAGVETFDEYVDEGDVERGEVTFVGPMKSWDRILYFELTEDFAPRSLQEAFGMLMFSVLPEGVEPEVLVEERLELFEPALFTIVKTADYYGPGNEGAEACLVFERDGFIYLLTRADGPMKNQLLGSTWTAERIDQNREALTGLANSMVFP